MELPEDIRRKIEKSGNQDIILDVVRLASAEEVLAICDYAVRCANDRRIGLSPIRIGTTVTDPTECDSWRGAMARLPRIFATVLTNFFLGLSGLSQRLVK